MDQLIKYILFVNVVLILVLAGSTISFILYENYTLTYGKEVVLSPEEQNEVIYPPKGPLFILRQVFGFLFTFMMPLLVVVASGYYQYSQYSNPTIRSYAKSLLIPFSYIFIAFFLTLLSGKLIGLHGEENMVFFFIWMQFAITFLAVAIVNFWVFLFKRA